MKWILCPVAALLSSICVADANAWTKFCAYGNAASYGWSGVLLNPTFIHQVNLAPEDAAVIYEYGGVFALSALSGPSGCSVNAVNGPFARDPNDTVYANIVNGLASPSCSDINYRYEFIRFFEATWMFQDPSDPFGVWFIYDGPYPEEGIKCPQGYVTGVLANPI